MEEINRKSSILENQPLIGNTRPLSEISCQESSLDSQDSEDSYSSEGFSQDSQVLMILSGFSGSGISQDSEYSRFWYNEESFLNSSRTLFFELIEITLSHLKIFSLKIFPSKNQQAQQSSNRAQLAPRL